VKSVANSEVGKKRELKMAIGNYIIFPRRNSISALLTGNSE
jgi:hypothetical protein